jgi:uncharacterized protein (TIGR00297 family)
MHIVNPLVFVPIGFALSAAIALLAYRRESLTRSGVAGAMLTGTLYFGFGGLTWGLTLIAFFVSSTLLSRYQERDKAPIAAQYAKGERRDGGQALANGGVGALLAVCFNLHPTIWLFVAFVGVMATVAGDTWATELGVLSRRPPRLVTTGHAVPAGTSGGITLLGTGAMLAGSLVIGLVAWGLAAVFGSGFAAWWIVLVGLVAGLAGGLADSLLGATVQAQYRDRTGAITEKAGATRVRGVAWMTNDTVNLLASLIGGAVGAGIGIVFS